MQIINSIFFNIYEHFVDIYHNPFSLFFNAIVIVFIVKFFLAIYFPIVRKYLIKMKMLEEKENPKGFFYLLLFIYITMKFIQIFIFQIFVVDGPSMSPTFETGNVLIVDRMSSFNNPAANFDRGSVMVFNLKKIDDFAVGKYLIKRIIGVPGDTVVIENNKIKIITRDGDTIFPDESYIIHNQNIMPNIAVELSKDQYFLMGDNRDNSHDSRYFGPINKSDIAGEAVMMLYPNLKFYPGKSLNYK